MTLYELAAKIDALLKMQTVDYSGYRVEVRLDGEYAEVFSVDVSSQDTIVIDTI